MVTIQTKAVKTHSWRKNEKLAAKYHLVEKWQTCETVGLSWKMPIHVWNKNAPFKDFFFFFDYHRGNLHPADCSPEHFSITAFVPVT